VTKSVIKIGILIFDDVEELDFVGPYEVFTMINTVCDYQGQPDKVSVALISENGKDITGKKGMRVGAHIAMTDVKKLDVLLVPGGQGARTQIENTGVLDWIISIATTCRWTTSVCTGSFILAKAGLTKGKRLSTYWAAFDEFKKLGLSGDLIPHVRYVRDGNLVTSAGVSAGIDMALWLTGQMFDPDLARNVQRAMQYDPAPPYTAET
jgi:transcriptional regulator GlxA family with amidase domain